MSTPPRRIGVLMAVFVVAAAAVLVQLGWLMLVQNETWTLRSYTNRWTFRDVPTHRGAILDRDGNALAYDTPSFELLVDYQSFRRYHPLGAAVHGATLLADYTPSLAGVRYSYARGPRGPEAACQALLDLPLAWLHGKDGPRELTEDKRDVRFYCVSLLSACSHRSRSRVYRELRQAEQAAPSATLGEALPGLDAGQLTGRYLRALEQLRAADRELLQGGGHGKLIDRLDRFREEFYAQAADSPADPSRLRLLADRVSFDLAAGLRTLADDHPGLWLQPAVVRERSELARQSPLLGSLLGGVRTLDRLAGLEPDDDAAARKQKLADLQQDIEARAEQILGMEGLDQVVPEDLAPFDIRQQFQKRARRHVEALVRNGDRKGSSGVEEAMDDQLAGDPGLRLVERDKQSREQKLWSRLEVQPGQDVQLSLDLQLQRLGDQVVAAAAAQYLAHARVPRLFGACLVVLDAASGEVLAVSGEGDGSDELQSRPLGLNWRGNGALGSVVKPFVVLEQLQAEALGLAHRPLAAFHDCGGGYGVVAGQRLECLHADGEAGRIPQLALMRSCNAFFFQAAEGLGRDGLERALRRFDLLPVEDASAAAPHVPFGVSPRLVSAPEVNRTELLQKRAIGYGLVAGPVLVARAYGALATGVLCQATLVRGQALPAVPLDLSLRQLEIVREGLRLCVDDPLGTAHDQAALRRFGVHGKTGTAEVSTHGDNNAWFAGYLPYRGAGGVQLAFAAVVYGVPHKTYGGEVAGAMLGALLEGIAADPVLQARYQLREAR